MSNTSSSTPPPSSLTRALSVGIDASNIAAALTRALQEFSTVTSGQETVQQLAIQTLNTLIANSSELSPTEKSLLTQVVSSFAPILLGFANGSIATCEASIISCLSATAASIVGLCKKPITSVPVPAPKTTSTIPLLR